MKTQVVEYNHGSTVLEGYIAYDDAITERRPGVLIIHEYWGHNPYVRRRAEELARLGYVGFAIDMYGKGVTTKDAKKAGQLMAPFASDRQLTRARTAAALDVLKKQAQVDSNRLAAMGYCFGGMCSLELARSGADLKAVVSFHGNLTTPNPADAQNIKAMVLVCHGADDPYLTADQVAGFQDEMRKAKVDWEFIAFGNAVHSFTYPEAGNNPSTGLAYNEKADKRSLDAMKAWFAEALAR